MFWLRILDLEPYVNPVMTLSLMKEQSIPVRRRQRDKAPDKPVTDRTGCWLLACSQAVSSKNELKNIIAVLPTLNNDF